MDGGTVIARQHASLQLPNPVPAFRQCQIRLARQVVFEAAFIELFLVKTSECRRQTTKRPDQLELRGNDCNDEAESRFMCKLETLLGFNLRFRQRISRCEQTCIQVVAAICPEREVAGSIRDIERATYEITTRPNVLRPWHDEAAKCHVRSSPIPM